MPFKRLLAFTEGILSVSIGIYDRPIGGSQEWGWESGVWAGTTTTITTATTITTDKTTHPRV